MKKDDDVFILSDGRPKKNLWVGVKSVPREAGAMFTFQIPVVSENGTPSGTKSVEVFFPQRPI